MVRTAPHRIELGKTMSVHRRRAGARLRVLLSVLGLLSVAPVHALELGELQPQSGPGQAYRATVPVSLNDLDRQELLVVSAYALVPNGAGGESRVPLTVQRDGSIDSEIHLLGRDALADGSRVQVTASSAGATVSRSYQIPSGVAVVPQNQYPPAPAPAYQAPAAVADSTPPAPLEPATPPPAWEAPQPAPARTPRTARSYNDTGLYLRPVVELGYELGGDKLVEVSCYNTTDNSYSTPSLRAGNGLLAGVGGHLRPSRNSPWDLRLTFDYKYQAACESVNLQRFRLTLLPSYSFGPRHRWWAGAGMIYETGIRFDGKNLPVENAPPGTTLGTFDFNDALGATVQVGWWFLALDYNFIKYSKDDAHVNANSIGLLFTYGFDFF
jgi:hypothetical protein